MKGSVKARAGVAIGNMRLDGIRMQDVGKGRPKAKEARERMAERLDGEVQHISDKTYRERMTRAKAETTKTLEEVARSQINDAVESVLDNLKKMGEYEAKAKSDYNQILNGDIEMLKEYVLHELKRSDRMNINGITDQVVNEIMGGSRAAENQANAYRGIIDNIKAGGRTGEPSESLATAARKKMLDREQNSFSTRKDIVRRLDAAENVANRNHAEFMESAKAWANAGRC